MKLITKTILYFLGVSIPLVVVCLFLGFHLVNTELEDAATEALWKEKHNAEKLINVLKPKETIYLSTDSLSKIIVGGLSTKENIFTDSLIYDQYEDEELPFRFFKSYYTTPETSYTIIVAKNTLEHDDLMESLLMAFGLLLGFLLITFFALNWILSKTLWKPFYKTLAELKKYDLHANTAVSLESTSTKEFKQLNHSLNEMMDKIQTDFRQQKEFTENASHEMQTPLAVIKANITLLMQSPNLKQEEMEQLQAIDNTARKMASLNKALILLAKIENHQFKDNTKLSLKEIVNRSLNNYEDIIASKEITLENKIQNDIELNMNAALADTLITNLLQNAIRHNYKGGKIILETNHETFSISNTGEALSIDAKDLFVRFKKNDTSKESLGLGLSIVKSITDHYKYTISYSNKGNLHTFAIDLK